MNYSVALAFAAILASLCFALYYLLKGGSKDTGPNRNMAKALGFRVAFSIALFVCVLLAWKLGYLHPTGIPIRQ